MSKSKNEVTSPINFLPLSQISNPGSLVNEPGDSFTIKVTPTGKKVAKLHAGGVKRAMVQHKNGGKIVETTSY